MRRAITAYVVGLAIFLSACDGVRVRPADNLVITSGFVSVVQFGSFVDHFGFFQDVTLVTLVNRGFAQDLAFCGHVVNIFPVDAFFRVQFEPGFDCIEHFTATRIEPPPALVQPGASSFPSSVMYEPRLPQPIAALFRPRYAATNVWRPPSDVQTAKNQIYASGQC